MFLTLTAATHILTSITPSPLVIYNWLLTRHANGEKFFTYSSNVIILSINKTCLTLTASSRTPYRATICIIIYIFVSKNAKEASRFDVPIRRTNRYLHYMCFYNKFTAVGFRILPKYEGKMIAVHGSTDTDGSILVIVWG